MHKTTPRRWRCTEIKTSLNFLGSPAGAYWRLALRWRLCLRRSRVRALGFRGSLRRSRKDLAGLPVFLRGSVVQRARSLLWVRRRRWGQTDEAGVGGPQVCVRTHPSALAPPPWGTSDPTTLLLQTPVSLEAGTCHARAE